MAENHSGISEDYTEEELGYLSRFGEKCRGCIYDGMDEDECPTTDGRRCKIFRRKPDMLMAPRMDDPSKCPYYNTSPKVDTTLGKCNQCKKCMYMNWVAEDGDGYRFDPKDFRLPYCAATVKGTCINDSDNYTGRPTKWDKYVQHYAGKPYQVIMNLKKCDMFIQDDEYEEKEEE